MNAFWQAVLADLVATVVFCLLCLLGFLILVWRTSTPHRPSVVEEAEAIARGEDGR